MEYIKKRKGGTRESYRKGEKMLFYLSECHKVGFSHGKNKNGDPYYMGKIGYNDDVLEVKIDSKIVDTFEDISMYTQEFTCAVDFVQKFNTFILKSIN